MGVLISFSWGYICARSRRERLARTTSLALKSATLIERTFPAVLEFIQRKTVLNQDFSWTQQEKFIFSIWPFHRIGSPRNDAARPCSAHRDQAQSDLVFS